MLNRDTSVAAYDSVKNRIPSIEERVKKFVREQGLKGATCDEVEIALNLRHQTCSARFSKLCKLGDFFDSGEKRKTRSGRKAIVWRDKKYRPPAGEQLKLFTR